MVFGVRVAGIWSVPGVTYDTAIFCPLHSPFRPLRSLVYAVPSLPFVPVPYNAAMMSQSVGAGECDQNAPVI